MTQLSGKCLCGQVAFSGDADIKMMANCHCRDCRGATGAAYGTLIFVAEGDIAITGELKAFNHKADSGADMQKLFCPNCGSQMFGKNANRPGMMSVRAGIVDQADVIKPAANVFMESRIPSTPIDPALKAFDKMPG